MTCRKVGTACVRAVAALFLITAVCTAAVPAAAQVIVVVNGLPITSLDIEQRMRLEKLTSPKQHTRDQILKMLVDDKLKITIAKRYGLELSDSDVELSFGEIAKRTRQSPEQFSQALLRSGIAPSALKSRIRADIVWSQLVRGKFGASLQVSEGELALAAQANQGSAKEETGYIYTLRPIILVVPRGSSEGTMEAKRREAEAIRARFNGCDAGIAMARGLRDVAVRDPVRRSSADVSPQLREILAKLSIGQLTSPEQIAQGLQMFALCDKKQSKSDTPEKRELRDKIFAERFEKEAKKFLEETRRSSIIEYR